MPEKITKLSHAQRARFSEWTEKWIAIGLCTDPADFAAADQAVRGCYAAEEAREVVD